MRDLKSNSFSRRDTRMRIVWRKTVEESCVEEKNVRISRKGKKNLFFATVQFGKTSLKTCAKNGENAVL